MKKIKGCFFSHNLYGAFLIILTGLLSGLNNSLIHSLPIKLPAIQILFFKSSISVCLLSILFGSNLKQILKTSYLNLHILRSGCGALGNWIWIIALLNLPLAESAAISMSSAIFTATGGMIIFSEKSTIQRWALIIFGFLGVLIILNPGIQIISIYSILPLFSALLFSCSSLLVKQIAKKDSAKTTLMYLMLLMTLFSLPMAIINWITPSLSDLIVLIAIGGLYSLMQLLLFEAYKYADISFVAPFKYMRFPTNILIGVFLFGELPAYATLIGGAIIALSSIQLVLNEKWGQSTKLTNPDDLMQKS
jgi:drug/metabolite transporter (DMT)-like permease